ncbi:aspartate-semialdehyde dehydrogenase, partial [Xanthomonas citri pv. citri]|nr:aspartate-semialdehyde dehydrogenase [Xanthomonas citri pv. citri]
LVWEIKKILGDDSILVNFIVVCVLVFYGYFEVVIIEICDKVIVVVVCELLLCLLGVEVVDKYEVGGYLILVMYVLGN